MIDPTRVWHPGDVFPVGAGRQLLGTFWMPCPVCRTTTCQQTEATESGGRQAEATVCTTCRTIRKLVIL